MVEFYPDEETEMRVGDVSVPGVYRVRESGGGYTSDYVAQKLRARAQAQAAREGGGGGGGGGGGTTPRSGEVRTIQDPSVPVQQWGDRTDVSGSPPQMDSVGNLNVGGDHESNKLVSGNFRASMSGNGWSLRNIGVGSPTSNGSYAIAAQGTGIIEHCYLGEGSSSDTGIFVHPNHGGTILIRFCYLSGFHDNGIYGSAPGNGPSHTIPGNGGTVIVENCYLEGNEIANLRLGTTGSGAKNTVMHNPASRGNRTFWGYYESPVLQNCDMGGRIVAGEDAHPKGREVSVTLNNCRWNGQGGVSTAGSSSVAGADEAQSRQPNFAPPGRVPTSPQAAAQGTYWSRIP